ncbi:MAG: hypothetical protein JRG85_11105 [Deltaproteobacteria bacterium]|nr:hypothetical protein [Deltaproteobacteria bacterium]
MRLPRGPWRARSAGELRWALDGRNRTQLEALRADLGRRAANLERVLGDGDDEAFLDTLTARARVVCSAVEPYAVYGSKRVATCARNATHYCDPTGEVHWMQRLIGDTRTGRRSPPSAADSTARGRDSSGLPPGARLE